ncbi:MULTISPECIES: NADP-dependent oxidoreductase [unclassified Streptomyces]|uniref:NADP-dependent oxidoreductase n=1 Tax=unclassified Streptomyces TaxID=2593676 RepID=UPI001BE7E589|nr:MULTISPECIES: NADP-dependent oxidoreductase [unclassified Streptomyces]MBT2406798.1 NADP-dependent oxidoreductase [Streptomyces sp. ISL-21]MBT2612194.1 NADP-dependent oxidoreductase [Streptomyces sp. ISL-87]
MQAAVVSVFGGPEQLEIAEVAVPRPAAGQVRIRVRAAGVNPVDGAVRVGVFGGEGQRIGLGWDVAGEIDEVGAGVTGWSAGQRVVGLHYGPVKPLGTHAEYVVLDASAVAAAPATVDDVAAAALPLSGLTAARAVDLLGLAPGASVLVTGAAGVVGGLAVQLAARAGLVVTALAGAEDEALVRSLGAAAFVPRGGAPAEPVDGVVDAAVLGGAALSSVRDGGVYVGLIPHAAPAAERGIRVEEQEVAADGAHLARLVSLVDAGELTLRVSETFALADAAKAHARLAEPGVRGRLVLTL